MFNPTQSEVRQFFFDVYNKVQQNVQLSDIEKIAFQVIATHPEYNHILENVNKYKEFQWTPELEQTNPFLHMSMHITLYEQLSIDQPQGIRQAYNSLCKKYNDEHETQHQIIDCIGEMLWQAHRSNTQPSAEIYLSCINHKVNS
jgi:hypothetical protein